MSQRTGTRLSIWRRGSLAMPNNANEFTNLHRRALDASRERVNAYPRRIIGSFIRSLVYAVT